MSIIKINLRKIGCEVRSVMGLYILAWDSVQWWVLILVLLESSYYTIRVLVNNLVSRCAIKNMLCRFRVENSKHVSR
jgi:hypothetical protein